MLPTFVSLDFETANSARDSACAVGMVRVAGRRVVDRFAALIRPPTREFRFRWVHGISYADVRAAPRFVELWPRMERFLRGAEFIAAHNASFDRGVLHACARTASIEVSELRFVCTMRLARRVWDLRPTKLSDVCAYLDIELDHHNALSDAEAAARIVLAAQREGEVVGG